MRKYMPGALLAILLTLLAMPFSMASAIPKNGASCSKLSASKKSAGLTYTCIKSPKGYNWMITMPIPTKVKPIQSSTPAQAANSSSATIPTPLTSTSPTPAPTPTLSTDDLKYQPVLNASYTQVLQLPDQASNIRIQFMVDPNFPPAVAAGIEAAANVDIAKFGNLIPENIPLIEVLSASSAFELQSFQSNQYLNEALSQNNGVSQSRDTSYNNKINVSALTFGIFNGQNMSAIGVVYRDASTNPPALDEYAVGAHETMHVVQDAISNGRAAGFLPMWFVEGQATQIGDLNQKQDETSSYVLAVTKSFPFPQGSNDLTSLETFSGMDCCGVAYSRGMAASVYLTGKYGWDKVLKFDEASTSYSDWKTAFQDIFGESVSQFYDEVQPFILWMKSEIQP